MTRKMIIAVALCLIATAPVASASPMKNSLASFGDWIEGVVADLTAYLVPAEDESSPLSTPENSPPEGEDEASWMIDPHGEPISSEGEDNPNGEVGVMIDPFG